MREPLAREAMDDCWARRWPFINNTICHPFVISFHPPTKQFSLLAGMTNTIGLLPRFGHRIDSFSTTRGQRNPVFNLVCKHCVSLRKAINFVFKVFLSFILWVCVVHARVCAQERVCEHAWGSRGCCFRQVGWQVNFQGSFWGSWHKWGFKVLLTLSQQTG